MCVEKFLISFQFSYGKLSWPFASFANFPISYLWLSDTYYWRVFLYLCSWIVVVLAGLGARITRMLGDVGLRCLWVVVFCFILCISPSFCGCVIGCCVMWNVGPWAVLKCKLVFYVCDIIYSFLNVSFCFANRILLGIQVELILCRNSSCLGVLELKVK